MTQYFQGTIKGANTITGGTDNTTIGNIGDNLKVTSSPSTVAGFSSSWSSKLRYDDMTGVARGTNISTSWTTVYTYSGSGNLAGMFINVETFNDWEFRLVVDGETIFSLNSGDLTSDTLYDLDDVTDTNQGFLGLSKGSHDRLVWHSPLSYPIRYNSSVQVQLRLVSGTKKFQAGLIILSKET